MVLVCSPSAGRADTGRYGEQTEVAARWKPLRWNDETSGADNLSLDPHCRVRGSRFVGIWPQTQRAFRERRQDPFRRWEELKSGANRSRWGGGASTLHWPPGISLFIPLDMDYTTARRRDCRRSGQRQLPPRRRQRQCLQNRGPDASSRTQRRWRRMAAT